MVKRTSAQTAAKSATKKPKLDPALAAVSDVIKNAGHLPERCRAMLVDLLPFSLAFTADVRSEKQVAVVGMLEETLMAIKSEMEADVASRMATQEGLETTMADRVKAFEEANVAVNAQKEVVEAGKISLDDATMAMNTSQKMLDEKQEMQTSGDEKFVSTKKNKEALETALKEYFQIPMENSDTPKFDGLQPFLHQLDIETSLLTALPTTCAKDKASHGNFDELVLKKFEEAMTLKITGLNEVVVAESPAAADREEQVKHAEMAHNSRKEGQKQANDALDASKKEVTEREAVLDNAKEAVTDIQRQLEVATGLHENAKANMGHFEDSPLANFFNFKSKTATFEEAALAGA